MFLLKHLMYTCELQTQNLSNKICHHELGAQVRTTRTHRKIVVPTKSKFEIDSTLH